MASTPRPKALRKVSGSPPPKLVDVEIALRPGRVPFAKKAYVRCAEISGGKWCSDRLDQHGRPSLAFLHCNRKRSDRPADEASEINDQVGAACCVLAPAEWAIDPGSGPSLPLRNLAPLRRGYLFERLDDPAST